MNSVAEYEAWKAQQQQASVKASAFVVGNSDGNPDQLAGDLKLATDFSAATGSPKPPAPMVGEYRSVFQAAIDKTRAETILSRSPRLTDWLRDPENATLAKDDLDNLSWWEKPLVIPRNIVAGVGPGFAQQFYNLLGVAAALPGKNAASDYLLGMADRQGQLKDIVAGPKGGWFDQQLAGASQSIGLMLPGIAATLLSGGTAVPGLAAAYLVPGAITQGGQSARAALDAGKTPAQALLYGGTDAAAEVLFERLPVGKLLGDIAQGAGFGKIFLRQLAYELPTETATTLYQNLNAWMTLNPEKSLKDFVAEQPAAIRDTVAQTFLATLGISGLGAGASKLARVQEQRAQAKDAENRVALFQELSGQAVASKLRARMPDRFRDFVERATQNGPVENVFVPAQEFARYFQEAGADPYAVGNELGVSRDDMDAALAGGGDLKIMTAAYAEKIAGSEHDAFLMQNMRFDPMEMTAQEAADFNARVDDVMQEMWAEAEDIRQEDERWRAVEEKIHDQVVSQMRMAGLSTERAMAEVQPIVAFYRTRAARMGLTTEEYLAKNPLPGVQGAIPQGMQFKNVDELNRTLAEARLRRGPAKDGRQSLLEFIDAYGGVLDAGGELKARNADLIKRGRGKKSLRLARDPSIRVSSASAENGRSFGVDDVARAAIDAGFMAENPDVIAYKASMANGTETPDITRAFYDAIDAEMRGEKQALIFDAKPLDTAYLDEIETYLDRLGVDLSNTDEEIRAAIEADQAGRDRMYGQPATELVGDVVPADGLLLLHGSPRADLTVDEIEIVREGSKQAKKGRKLGGFYATAVKDGEQARGYARMTGAEGTVYEVVVKPGTKVLRKEGDITRLSEGDINRWVSEGYGLVVGKDVRGRTEYVVIDKNAIQSVAPEGQSVDVNSSSVTEVRRDQYESGETAVEYKLGENAVASVLIAPDKTAHLMNIQIGDANSNDRAKGRGTAAYAEIGRRLASEGVTLQSTQWSKHNTAISPAALRVWEKLAAQGLARQVGTEQGKVLDRFTGQEEVKDIPIYEFVPNNRGTFDPNDARVLYQGGTHPFAGFTREQFLGNAKITSNANAATLVPKVLASTDAVNAVPFAAGRGLTAKYNEDGAAVFDGDQVVASYNHGDTLVVAKKYRKQGIAEELVYQWRMQNPNAKPSKYRTKASQKLQEKVWDRIQREMPKPGKLLFQNQSGPRGQIEVNMDGSTLIRLFETANLSTVQHELGHFFLLMLQRDVASGDQGSVAEYEVIKSWWRENAAAVAADGNRAMPDAKLTAEDVQRAIDTGSTGDMIKDAAIDVGMQEQWARGYEAYLMEGKAPSADLRGAFEKFRSWMISVYKSLLGLNVKISPEIRGVFDRMLATDEEIAKAGQATGSDRAVFTTAEQMGLTQDEFARLMKLRVQSEDEAKARLLREIMEPIKRQKEQWFKDEKAKVEAEVTRQVNALPVFRALEWLGNRRWLGDGQPEEMPDMRMSKDILVERYGEGVLSTLPRGKFTVYAVDGGMDPDEIADWFGFQSGDEMIRMMERAPNRKEAIKAETDRVMNERHGDALKDGEIEAIALDAVHTDKRGEWLAAELKAVAAVAGVDVNLTMKAARASARQTIARMTVRDAVAANRYLAAERKAGEEAARLGAMLAREGVWMQNARRRVATKARAALRDAGTVDAVAGQIDQANNSTGNYNETVQKLIDAKRRQLVNHALFMEARAVADEVEKAEGYVRRLNKASMREKIAGAGRRENAQVDYLAAIDEILDQYDFRKMSGRAEQRRGALVAFVDAMKAAGRENELSIPEAVLRQSQMKPYKGLKVEELRGVIDSLKNLQHVALRWNDLIDGQNQRKLDEAVAAITEAFDANLPKRPPGRVRTRGEALRNSVRQFIDLVLNAGTILREIDGFKDMGAAYANLKAPIDQAMDRLTIRKEKAAADMEALYAVYSKEDRRAMAVRKVVPGLPFSLSKWEMIAVALNTGNEGNLQRLTDPKVRGHLTEAQVAAVLAKLDERDAAFVQSVWDYIGTFRDDIAARERRTTGVEPAWVDASPVTIAGKALRGGYYPLKYDPRLSTLARDDEAQAIGEALQAGRFGKAQTKRGHLEARAQSSGRDVELDMSVFHRHVNQVIYDLELSEAVSNSWKVLQSGAVRQSFMDAGRQADFDALETWLKDVAEGQLAAGDWINKTARTMKSNFTAAKLAFNLGTVASQVSGLSQTMVVVGKKDFLRGLQMSFQRGIGDQIAAKSPFMRERQTTFNKDISDFYNDPAMGPTASRWGEIKREWVGPASFWMMTKVQWLLVDIPTWLGGYQQGLRMFGNDEAKAVAHADAIVKRAQASGLFADRSAIERGSVSRTTRQSDVVRLLTTLGSYMFAKFNVAYERAAVGGKVIRAEGVSVRSVQEIASLTLDMAFLFTLEAIIMAAIKGHLPGGDDDEEGWGAFLARETAFSVLGTIPFVRDIASFTQGFEGGGAYGGIVAEVGKPFVEISQGELDKGLLKSIINGTGLVAGIPATTQINRVLDGLLGYASGDMSPMEALKVGAVGK